MATSSGSATHSSGWGSRSCALKEGAGMRVRGDVSAAGRQTDRSCSSAWHGQLIQASSQMGPLTPAGLVPPGAGVLPRPQLPHALYRPSQRLLPLPTRRGHATDGSLGLRPALAGLDTLLGLARLPRQAGGAAGSGGGMGRRRNVGYDKRQHACICGGGCEASGRPRPSQLPEAFARSLAPCMASGSTHG